VGVRISPRAAKVFILSTYQFPPKFLADPPKFCGEQVWPWAFLTEHCSQWLLHAKKLGEFASVCGEPISALGLFWALFFLKTIFFPYLKACHMNIF
jgi:hypothetical protein